MKKKLLFFVIALGISTITFSQNLPDDVITAVEKQQKKYLNSIAGQEQDITWPSSKKKNPNFLIKEKESLPYGEDGGNELKSDISIGEAYNVVKDANNKFEIQFSYDKLNREKAEPILSTGSFLKTITFQKKKKIIGYNVVYRVNNCHTKLKVSYKKKEKRGENKDIIKTSDATYDITLTWHVGVKVDDNGKLQKIDKITLKSIEKSKPATNAVNEEIAKFYSNLSTNFADRVEGETIKKVELKPGESLPTEQSISKLLREKKVNITKEKKVNITEVLPSVQVDVDPKKYMSSGSNYENPVAYYTFKPIKFVITFSDDNFKEAKLSEVEFEQVGFTGPKTVEDKQNDMEDATKLFSQSKDEIAKIFTNYTQNPNKETEEQFKSLFVKKAKVHVKTLTKQGVKDGEREADIYTKRVKGATVEIQSISEPKDVNVEGNWSAKVDFIQHTVRDTYCDYTKKCMMLVKDDEGNVKISEIIVLEDPTPCEE